MLICLLNNIEGLAMEWLVIDVVYLKKQKNYALILHGGPLKMIAEVTTDFPVQPGDSLYPVRDAINPLINDLCLFIESSQFTLTDGFRHCK
ncbi:hypothetical protein [Enterobacter sp. 22466]|uniref:hypothetical protein n=1 Tax=Enterobacter sp. 22466 TaxID=3453924 RepID=UPI003F85120F